MPDSISGQGHAQLEKAQLVNIPTMDRLISVMKLARRDSKEVAHNDRAEASFELHPDHVLITASELITPTLFASATGKLHYDGRLDMRVQAGPLQKLENALGNVGDWLKKAHGKLLAYDVKGTVNDPKVTPVTMGIRLGR